MSAGWQNDGKVKESDATIQRISVRQPDHEWIATYVRT